MHDSPSQAFVDVSFVLAFSLFFLYRPLAHTRVEEALFYHPVF